MTTLPPPLGPIIEGDSAASPVVLVCEHASNAFPAPWGTLGLTPDQQQAHIAWDIGALGLARGLAMRMGATLVHAPVSRLIYDLNRAPHQTGAMPARSEVHDVPGNQTLTAQDRAARVAAVYLPFHHGLHAVLMQRLAAGVVPVVITVHSFTPVYFGTSRAVEFGVIHDADPSLATAIVAEARTRTDLRCALNEPYSAADDVTHTLRLHATPYALPNAMLEVRNDLITTPAQQDSMADMLAPVLLAALQKGAA
ncbi:MAG: N-formylglutamate amidohydrolase [Pseudomonadota bacterium]